MKGRDHLGDLGIDGRIILKFIPKNKVWNPFNSLNPLKPSG
jgi:hypothetical protein